MIFWYLSHWMIAFHFWGICFRSRLKDNSKKCSSWAILVELFHLAFALVWLWMWVNINFNRANIRVVIRGVIKRWKELYHSHLHYLFVSQLRDPNAVATVSSSKFGNSLIWEVTSLLCELSCMESFRLLCSSPW